MTGGNTNHYTTAELMCNKTCSNFCTKTGQPHKVHNVFLAEWLRRRLAKPMGSPCVGSNPTGVAFTVLHRPNLMRAIIGVNSPGLAPKSCRCGFCNSASIRFETQLAMMSLGKYLTTHCSATGYDIFHQATKLPKFHFTALHQHLHSFVVSLIVNYSLRLSL